jgi:DNA-binding GntR family transcriptional regulator
MDSMGGPGRAGAGMSEGMGRDLVGLIRSMILTGDIPPGEKILPRVLQARFGVSHIPVREALRALEAEGLVVTVPRRGSTAAAVSMDELTDVYSLRRLLEPPLMRQAATQVHTAEEVRAAEAALARLEATDPADMEGFLAAHHDFHWVMIRAATGPLGRRLLDQLWVVSERYVRLGVSAFHVDQPARHDHRHLMDAYLAGDGDRAEEETSTHLRLVEATIRAHLRGPLSP